MGKVEEREGKGGQEIKDSDASGIEGERMSMEWMNMNDLKLHT